MLRSFQVMSDPSASRKLPQVPWMLLNAYNAHTCICSDYTGICSQQQQLATTDKTDFDWSVLPDFTVLFFAYSPSVMKHKRAHFQVLYHCYNTQLSHRLFNDKSGGICHKKYTNIDIPCV